MKNNVVLKITGNNTNRFINKIIKNNIYIYDLNKISNKEFVITIKLDDLEKISKISPYYDIKIIKYVGISKFKKTIKKNYTIFIFLCISIFCIILVSNFIFDIKIYHTNNNLKELLYNELKNYGIKRGSFKKSFDEIEKIKDKISKKYKDKIEWLEITRVGTTYNIRLEERIINKKDNDNTPQNIVAAKSGIIKDVYAKNGIILKRNNDYVSKGDVIVSGEIYLNESLKEITRAEAKVYAETWYTAKIDFPLYYKEEIYTNKSKKVINIQMLNKDINLFNFNKFKKYRKKDLILYKNNILPIQISIQDQKEIYVIENIYNNESAINKAIEYATKKIEDKLSSDEYIISKKVLKNIQKNSTIYIEIFFKIYEDITASENIVPLEENYD